MITLEQIEAARVKGEQDLDILKPIFQPKDWDTDFFKGDRYYTYYKAIARVVQPRIIAEIGVRFGYSLYAMAMGCKLRPTLIGFDDGCYESTWREVAGANLHSHSQTRHFILHQWNTQTRQPLPFNNADLFHVDGCHSTEGALCDLYLALKSTKDRGLLLLDDVDFLPDVREAGEVFRKVLPRNLYVPTSRGMWIYSVE